ncbi:MAG: CRTAC1 family protein, partial [Gammaproteobacteria bacterium]
GWLDLFVANDTVRNFLYHNLGTGRFEEIGALEGIAFDRNGKATGAMGIDAAYYRNDAELGIGIGNFANEMSSLFVTADGSAPFADEAILEGFGPASRLALTFGLFFFDYDLDGRLDLFQANGHLESEINVIQPSQTYAQPAQLFWNCGPDCRDRFVQPDDTGDLAMPMVGRGAAYADIDADGDLDIVVIQNGRRAVLFRNDQQLGHHWLRVQLQGTRVNRSAIGALVELTANGVTQRRQVMPTRSYLSQVELPVTFGLGDSDRADALKITWPDGQVQEITVEQVDTLLTVVQSAVP